MLPTFRRFNLKKIHRLAMSLFKMNGYLIFHPTDKGLGPHVIEQEE